MQYFWKMPIYKNLSADDAAAELQSITDRNGGTLTAAAVVDQARPEWSILHQCFEWDDHEAAEKYRQKQAGTLIRNISVVVTEPAGQKEDQKPTTIPLFFNTSSGNTAAKYKKLSYVLNDKEAQKTVVKNALRDLQAYSSRYQELLNTFNVSDQLRAILNTFTTELEEQGA